jgi:NAD(P)-dependent dehydrogenase (short-subunit alcohol dehydrogenase family)
MGALDGLVAVVTGGASGIGRAACSCFLREGARVGALDVSAFTMESPDALAVIADVTDQKSMDDAMAAVAQRFGGIDILVNNAGISAVGTVEENSDEEWARVLDVNVTGMVRGTKAALPYLRRSSHAAIVNTSSIVANAGLAKRVLYSASKGAVHALTLAMAADLVTEGIRVNSVSPGTADTPWVARLLARTSDPDEERRKLAARQPMGRMVSAEEVAAAMLYLVSPAASATTGMSLAVDGGVAGLRLVR